MVEDSEATIKRGEVHSAFVLCSRLTRADLLIVRTTQASMLNGPLQMLKASIVFFMVVENSCYKNVFFLCFENAIRSDVIANK